MENEESEPHMYELEIPDSVIPKKRSEEAGSSKQEKPNLSNFEQEKLKQEKEEKKNEPEVIYNEDIGFRCQSKNREEEDFILSYGFAQEMFFVSKPVGGLDLNQRFSGRKIQLEGYLFSPPILEKLTHEQLHQKYYDLRERTGTLSLSFISVFRDSLASILQIWNCSVEFIIRFILYFCNLQQSTKIANQNYLSHQ